MLDVLEVDASTGKETKSLLRTDYGKYAFSANGKRLAVFDKDFAKVVTVYDIDRGVKLCDHKFAPLPRVKFVPPPGVPAGTDTTLFDRFLVISPDGRHLIVSRGISDAHVLNAETGEELPALEGTKETRIFPESHAFSGDGRLLAMNIKSYVKATRMGPGGREEAAFEPSANGDWLTVWDTQTGKALKRWNTSKGTATVLFHPSKPVLAILEANGENQTRLGLWDFSAEVEKK
jgi:WD40 repeat protein